MWDRLIVWLLSGLVDQLNRIEERLMTLQEEVDQRTQAILDKVAEEKQQIGDKLAAVATEIQLLKDQVAAGVAPDFTALDAAVAEIANVYTPS
jgi:chromosome segregation ATPase